MISPSARGALGRCCDAVASVAERIRWLAVHAPALRVSGTYWGIETTTFDRESVRLPRLWSAAQSAALWSYLEVLITD